MLSKEHRMNELRDFIPNAKSDDWDIVVAGQRVQVIKDTETGKGTLQFGTEVLRPRWFCCSITGCFTWCVYSCSSYA